MGILVSISKKAFKAIISSGALESLIFPVCEYYNFYFLILDFGLKLLT